MPRKSHPVLQRVLPSLFRSIQELVQGFDNRRPFTIDGRLVGDIGEVLAAEEYDVTLNRKLRKGYDGKTSDGRFVDVKATFKESLAFRTIPQYCIGFKLYRNGSYEVVFNGPGKLIAHRYRHRDGVGKKQLSFPISELKQLSASVSRNQRVRRRTSRSSVPLQKP